MKYSVIISLLLLLISVSCNKDTVEDIPCNEPDIAYYSDYFVFIADDDGSRLVIPMDFNWRPESAGYSREFKGWYGTSNDWPIAYFQENITTEPCNIPMESWEHKNSDYFQFKSNTREIIATIDGAPELSVSIPDSSQWVITPAEEGKGIYACKTTAKVSGNIRTGWLIYERIRRITGTGGGGGGDFESFFWIPLVIDDDFYHFSQHRGEQTASRWFEFEGDAQVETIPDFELIVTATSTDSISGRTNIPDSLRITANQWGIDLTFASTGSQVGYGPEFPNGLAYYRQSMLEPEIPTTIAYGMLELILEDD